MPSTFNTSHPSVAARATPGGRARWKRLLGAAVVASIASSSTAVLIKAGQQDPAEQAMLDAVRHSPALST